jgi:NADH-quinone oxidoreductase subunit A
MSLPADYGYAAAFALTAGGFILLVLTVSLILHTKRPSKEKLSAIECGMETFPGEWSQFKVRYYVFAIMFLLFDVEIAFIYPWACVFRELGAAALVEMVVFIGILVVGLVYAWKKGVLTWI